MSSFRPKSDLSEGRHLARRGPHIYLNLKLGQKTLRAEKGFIFVCVHVSEEERNKRVKNFLLRPIEFRWYVFVGPRRKVHCIDEGYAWVPRNKDFVEDPRREISGDQSIRV